MEAYKERVYEFMVESDVLKLRGYFKSGRKSPFL